MRAWRSPSASPVECWEFGHNPCGAGALWTRVPPSGPPRRRGPIVVAIMGGGAGLAGAF